MEIAMMQRNPRRIGVGIGVGLGLFLSPGLLRADASISHPTRARTQPLFAGLPMDFVQNLGQDGPAVRFVARKGPVAVSLEQDAIKLHLMQRPCASVSLTFEGASKRAQIVGEARRATLYNFY